MAAQLKIDYLTGYPGIPASDPSATPNPPSDPFVKLPVLLRPQGHLSGTVEVRPPLKGIRAKWLRVELEKVEIVPAPAIQRAKGEDSKRDKGAANEAKKEVRFVELIGNGPGTLWAAKESGDTETIHGKKIKKGEEDEGWDFIPENNYPFRIPLPEGLPPSTTVDSKGSGIEYQLVATLCGRGKKSLLKSNTKPILTSATAHVLLLKADILPSWPAYAPLLPTPIPEGLPWARASDVEVPGETREARMQMKAVGGGEIFIKVTREKGAFGPGDKVELQVTLWSAGNKPVKVLRLDSVLRESLTFRYPPPVNNAQPLRSPPRVTSIFTANATISASPEDNPEGFAVLYQNRPLTFSLSGVVPSGHTRVTVRTAKHIDVVYHMKIRAMLDGGEEVFIDNWATLMGAVGSREAKGLMEEIGWVEGLCDRPRPVLTAVDEPDIRAKSVSPPRPTAVPIPTTSNSVRSRTSSLPLASSATSTSNKLKSALRNSAYGDFPPSTPPDEETQANTLANATPGRSANGHANGSVNSSSRATQGNRYASPAPPQPSRSPVPPPKNVVSMDNIQRDDGPPPPMPNGSTKTYMSAEDEKLRLFQSARATASQQQLRIQNLSTETSSARTPHSHSISPSAEEEKERLYRQAQERRDILQASVSGSMPSPESEKMRLYREALDRRDYLQGTVARSSMDTQTDRSFEDEKARLHQASILSNEQAQASLIRRSRLQATMEVDRNGKDVGSTTPNRDQRGGGDYFGSSSTKSNPSTTPYSSPSTTATSTRNNTAVFSPENEKRRLFEEAKALARQRQEEARAELDRQNALLAEMEREEIQRLERELEEERLRSEAVVQARRVREEFEREQAERARIAEEKVQQRRMQEALEKERKEAEAREQMRREAEAREESRRKEAEARRVAEQERQAEAYRQSQLLKERMQREKDQAEAVAELQRVASAQAHEAQAAQRLSTVASPAAVAQANAELLQTYFALSQPSGELASPQPPFAAPQGASLERASSSASFAPGTNLSQATSAFYANAIANNSSLSQSPTTAEEKTAYLRTLRAREEARRKESMHLSQSPPQTTPEHRSGNQGGEARRGFAPTAQGASSPPATDQSPTHARHPQYASGEHSNPPSTQSYSPLAGTNQLQRQPLPVPSSPAPPATYRLGEPLYETLPQQVQAPAPHLRHQSRQSPAQPSYQPLGQQTYDVVPETPQPVGHGSRAANSYDQNSTSFDNAQALSSRPRNIPPSSRSPPAAAPAPLPTNGFTSSSSASGGQSSTATSAAGGSSQAPPQQYKTAREEKEEEEARRKAAATNGSSDEDGLPNYVSETGNLSQPAPSAAQEKQQLNAYYAAKAAVDAFSQSRGPPPTPPIRQSTSASTSSTPSQQVIYPQPQRSYSSPLGAIQEASSNGRRENGSETSPPQTGRGLRRPDSGSEGSFENHRDPAVSAGKRKVNSSSTPPPAQQHQRQGSGYQLNEVDFGTFSIGHDLDFNAAQEYLRRGSSAGVGGSQYHS